MIHVKFIYNWQGQPVNEYTISNGRYTFSAINIGAALTKLIVPNKDEKLENITLRYHDYKMYQDNPYLLGCIIDYEKFKNNINCPINHYFNCEFKDDTLIFTYDQNGQFIKVIYTLTNEIFKIEYDSNFEISQSIFFNLTGNVKGSVEEHRYLLNQQEFPIEDMEYFNDYNVEKPLNFHMDHTLNGISVDLETNNEDISISFGKYFNEGFFINKKTPAVLFSGIGLIVGLGDCNKYVSYHLGKNA